MPQCPLCHHSTNYRQYFCPPCAEFLSLGQRRQNYCQHCGRDLATGTICGACLNGSPPLDFFWAGFYYRVPLSALIQKWKFSNRPQYSAALSALMLTNPPPWLFTPPALTFDRIIAMPATAASIEKRLFNPAWELARFLSRHYNIPLTGKNHISKKNLIPQHELTQKQRSANIKGAFKAEILPPGQRLLLIDDVATTLATLNELALTLKKMNNYILYAWVLAH